MDVNKILASMFFLILVFLLVSRASEVSAILTTAGSVLTTQTKALQGIGGAGEKLIGNVTPVAPAGSGRGYF